MHDFSPTFPVWCLSEVCNIEGLVTVFVEISAFSLVVTQLQLATMAASFSFMKLMYQCTKYRALKVLCSTKLPQVVSCVFACTVHVGACHIHAVVIM